MGKLLILLGIILVGVGLLVLAGERIGMDRLPGNLTIRGERFTFYFPVLSCLLLSVFISALLWLIQWWRG